MKADQPLAKIFDEIFDRHLTKQIPHYKAYEDAEDEFEREYKHRRYSSFESYRVSRTRRIKGRKR
jgi:hypothetical protein